MTNPEKVHVKRPIVAAILLALALLAGVVLAFWRVPLETHLQSSNGPTPTLRISQTTDGPATQEPTPGPSPTIDLTGRATSVFASSGNPDETFLLAGDYLVTEEVQAGDRLCSTAIGAADVSWNGDYHMLGSLNHVLFTQFTLESGGSAHGTQMATFPRGTYRFYPSPYSPFGPPEGNGKAKLCVDWAVTLEAR